MYYSFPSKEINHKVNNNIRKPQSNCLDYDCPIQSIVPNHEASVCQDLYKIKGERERGDCETGSNFLQKKKAFFLLFVKMKDIIGGLLLMIAHNVFWGTNILEGFLITEKAFNFMVVCIQIFALFLFSLFISVIQMCFFLTW